MGNMFASMTATKMEFEYADSLEGMSPCLSILRLRQLRPRELRSSCLAAT